MTNDLQNDTLTHKMFIKILQNNKITSKEKRTRITIYEDRACRATNKNIHKLILHIKANATRISVV